MLHKLHSVTNTELREAYISVINVVATENTSDNDKCDTVATHRVKLCVLLQIDTLCSQ